MIRKKWTDREIAILRSLYADTRTSIVAKKIGCTADQAYRKAHTLGLHKSEAFFASPESGRTNGVQGQSTRFSKGCMPWNKGIHFISGGRSIETRFKPGSVPLNHKPVGSFRVTKEGYLMIKIGEGRNEWRLLHREVWKKAHGAYPDKGTTIVFKDRNRQNCDIGNLEIITRQELMKRNTVHNYPEEIKQVIRLNGVIRRKIHGK